MSELTIGRLADEAGVNVETIRYYQRRGLMPEPAKPSSGQRRYTADAVRRLRFIKRAQVLGFTLEDFVFPIQFFAPIENHEPSFCEAEFVEVTGELGDPVCFTFGVTPQFYLNGVTPDCIGLCRR